MEGPNYSSKLFYEIIKYGKFGALAGLLTLAFINGHKQYVANNPRKFLWDSFLMGLTAALAVAYIAWARGRTDLIPNLAFITFFLFFAYNVVRELSGFNEILMGQGDGTQKRILFGPVKTLVVGVVTAMAILALAAHKPHPLGFNVLLREGLVFGGLAALGELIIAWNHAEPPTAMAETTGLTFALFFMAHLLMQFGGFYNHIFDGTT